MRILRNYILRELVSDFMLTVIIFTLLMITLNLLRELTDLVVNRGVPVAFVGKLIIYLTPYLLTFTIPMSLLIAVFLVFGRLSADNEITAVFAAGISLPQLITPVLLFSLLLSTVAVFLNDEIAARAHFAQRKTMTEMGAQNPAAYLESGKFIRAFNGCIIFVYKIHGNRLENVRIYQPQGEGKPARTIVASAGRFVTLPDQKLLVLQLIDGSLDEPLPNDPERFYRVNFKTYNLTLAPAGAGEPEKVEKKLRDKNINELLSDIRRMKDQGLRPVEPVTELHYKLALSFANLSFVCIGLPLALKIRRREKSVSLGVSLALITVYWIMLAGGKTLALKGVVPPGIALWAGDIVLAVVGITLLKKVTEVQK